MSNLKKVLIGVVVSFIMLSTTVINTSASTNNKNYFSNSRENANEFSERVSDEDYYFRVYKDEYTENSNASCKVEEISKQEFDENKNSKEITNKLSILRASSEFDPTVGSANVSSNSDGYLHINTEVFRSHYNNSRFQATTYFAWEQFPAFHLTDTVGVFLSDGMHIDQNYGTISQSAFIHWDGTTDVFNNPIVHDPHSKGVAAKFDLSLSNAYHKMCQGYITTYAKFSQETTNNQTGTISGLYQHYLITIGDLSFDSTGKPSIAFSKQLSELTAPTSICTIGNM